MSYLGLPSAQAEFTLLRMHDSTSFANTLKFVAKVKTTGISDAIFKIRNRYETLIDELSGLPLTSKKEIVQPNLKQTLAIQFDQQRKLASSSNGNSWTIPANCYDLFSMLYALRRSQPKGEDSIRFNIDVESQTWLLLGRAESSGEIRTKMGRIRATHYKFSFHSSHSSRAREWKTDLLTNRIGKQGALLEIWLGDDSKHLPLKLRFGSGISAVEMNIQRLQ